MGLRRLFRRPSATPPPVVDSQASELGQAGLSPEQVTLAEEQAEDLREAWAELTEASQRSKVLNFQACTRTGQLWTENPAAVRAIAAVLRDFPKNGRQTSSPG